VVTTGSIAFAEAVGQDNGAVIETAGAGGSYELGRQAPPASRRRVMRVIGASEKIANVAAGRITG